MKCEPFSYFPRIAQWIAANLVVVFLLWSLWLAFEYLAFGPSSFVRIWDNGDNYMPARIAQGQMLADGKFPYWSPQWASGVDLLASGLSPLLDVMLFAFMPGWLAYGLVMWLQRFVAGYFTYRLLKDVLHLDILPSLYSGLVYALLYQSTMDYWHAAGFTLFDGLGLPGFPFILWAFACVDLQKKYLPYLYAAGLGALFSITSYYQFSLFFIPLIWYWFMFVTPRSTSKFWGMLILFTVFWLLSEWPVIWATLLNAPLSHRADWVPGGPIPVIEGWAHQVVYLRQLAWDNKLSLGILAIAMIVFRSRDRRLLALAGAMILGLGFFISIAFIQINFCQYLGFLSGFDFGRVRNFFPFLLIVLAGVGLHVIGRGPHSSNAPWNLKLSWRPSHNYSRVLQTLLFIVAVGVIVWQSGHVKFRTVMSEMLGRGRMFDILYRHPDLLQLAEKRNHLPPFRIATIEDYYQKPSYAWAYGLETADGYINLYPRRYREFWEQVIEPLTTVQKETYNLLHYWGNQVYLFSAPSKKFSTDAGLCFKDYYNLKLLSLANVRYIVSRLPIQDERLVRLPSSVPNAEIDQPKLDTFHERIANLRRHIRNRPFSILPISLKIKDIFTKNLVIYENPEVLPRFFLARQIQLFENPTQVLKALREASYDDLKLTAYLVHSDVVDLPLRQLGAEGGEVGIDIYSPDRIVLDVKCLSPSILIITNSYSPYWVARVDGDIARIFPVDHTFQGIYIDSGQHEVMLEYAPPYAIRVHW